MPDTTSSNDDRISSPPHLPGSTSVRLWLIGVTLSFSLLLVVWLLAALTSRSGLAGIDLGLVAWLHSPTDPRDPIGSPGFESIMRDITALGSNTFLILLTLLGTGLLALLQRPGAAAFLFTTATGALILNSLVKSMVARARPDFTSVTVTTDTTSFPSSHAMLTATVLLTLAALAAREQTSRTVIALLMGSAAALVFLVGFTRIYLGAHWPSDVLTGWVIGSAWVLAAVKLAETPQPPE